MPDCPECGRRAAAGDLFCRGCGHELTATEAAAAIAGTLTVAAIGPTTPWAGKSICFELGQFTLEGVGVLTAADLLAYDNQGHVIWAGEGMREWVMSLAAKNAPGDSSDQRPLVPPAALPSTVDKSPETPISVDRPLDGPPSVPPKAASHRADEPLDYSEPVLFEAPPSTDEKPLGQSPSELRGTRRKPKKRMIWAAVAVVALGALAAFAAVALSSSDEPAREETDVSALRDIEVAQDYLVSFDPMRFATNESDATSRIELKAAGQESPTSLSVEVNDVGGDYTASDFAIMVAGIIRKTKKAAGSSGAVSPVSLVDMTQLDASGLSFDAAVTGTSGQLHFRVTYLLHDEKLITLMASTDAEQWPEWQGSLSDTSVTLRERDTSPSAELLAVARTMQSPVTLCAFPDVAGDTVAYVGTNSTLSKARIFVQDPIRLKVYPVSRPGAKVSMASTSQQRVVWMQDPAGGSRDFDIWTYDLAQSIALPVCEAAGWQGDPDVGGDWTVWSDDRDGDTDIYGSRWSTESEQLLVDAEGEQVSPRTDGRWVVWEDQRSGSGFEAEKDIYGYNLETGREIPICQAAGDQVYPSVSEGYVVWKDFRHGSDNPDIYGFDLARQQEFVVSDGPGEESEPAVTNGRVIYRSAVSGSENSTLMGYDIASMTTSEVYSSGSAIGYCRAGDGTFVFLDLGMTGATTLRMIPLP